MRCPRCRGMKKMYKIANGYSAVNCGGPPPVDCPMCLGDGVVKTLEEAAKEVNKKKKNKEDNELRA